MPKRTKEEVKDTLFQIEYKNALESLGIELRKQLSFLEEAIKEDREALEHYKSIHGDLYYRPFEGDGYGEPTDLVKKPLVQEYRSTIKSLLDSLSTIENRLHIDTSKGDGDGYTTKAKEEQSGEHKEPQWDAKTWLEESRGKNKGSKK